MPVAVVEPAIGAERRIAVELVEAAVEFVGSRRRDQSDLDAPPAESAPCVLVVIVNSPIVSDVGRFGTKSSELVRMKLSWMLMPSWVTCVQSDVRR